MTARRGQPNACSAAALNRTTLCDSSMEMIGSIADSTIPLTCAWTLRSDCSVASPLRCWR